MSIIINNTLLQKHQIMGPNGYTIVGSPTIKDGIINNSDEHNCLSIDTFQFLNNEVEIVFKYKGNIDLLYGYNNSQNILSLTFNGNEFNITLNGTLNWGPYDGRTEGYCKFHKTKDGLTTMYLGPDGINWPTSTQFDSLDYSTTIDNIKLAPYIDSDNYIDLNHSYIKINGKLWFYQPQPTKYIIKDGKLVWADPKLYLENLQEHTYSCFELLDAFNPDTDELKVSFYCPSETRNNNGPLGGAFYNTQTDSKGICVAGYYVGYGDNLWKYADEGYSVGLNTLEIKNNTPYMNGNALSISSSGGEIARNFYLFASRLQMSGQVTAAYIGKIYCLEWKRNGQVYHHIVPVPQGLVIGNTTISTNGFFDIVTQTALTKNGNLEYTIGRDN